jgi:hypothetical protein
MALSKIDVANMLTGATPVANGGTALTSGFVNGADPRPLSKPLIINGNMAVAQRGTSFADVGDGVYTLDRFETQKNNDGAVTVTQEALTSGNAYNAGFRTALKCDVTTADGTLATNQRFQIQQIIEAQNLQSLKFGTANAENLTLAFWVKATKTGTHIVRLFLYDDDRSVSASYTVSSSDTWEHKVLNFPADTTGVIDNNNGAGMQVSWFMGAGASFQSGTLATTWGANTTANDAVGQVNGLDSTSNNFHLTGVQLEVGEYTSDTLPPFQHEDFADNLARCQRYYYFHVSEDVNAGFDTTICLTSQYNSSSMKGYIPLPTRMRVTPTLNQNTGANMYRVYESNSNATMTSISLTNESTFNTGVVNAGSSISVTQGSCGNLQTMDSTAFVAFDAEL